DATCLERNLTLALQVMDETQPVVMCVNLMDEAEKKHICVDLSRLQALLGCPVVGCAARSGEGISALLEVLAETIDSPSPQPERSFCVTCKGNAECRAAAAAARAKAIAAACTSTGSEDVHRADRKLDRLLTSRLTGIPVMLLLLGLVLWLTIAGANVPSELLSRALFSLQEPLRSLFESISSPWWLTGMLVDGLYRTVAWVVGVMLPPMAIFFPLFTLLEDVGYLPRVAFNLDHFFERAHAHGRQSLTMCMGLGCNACGVTGCRIIQSSRERLIAILTNSFMPCNGRFPTLIAVISMFFAAKGGLRGSVTAAAMLLLCIVLAVLVTFAVSRLLSATVLRGEASSFSLELPPYRMPRVSQVLIRSVLDRTVFTLMRAVTVAAPAGVLIWCAGNLTVGGSSILACLSGFLEPLGSALGMDGVLLLAFLLGFPANEIVIPCALMGYLSAGSLTGYESLSQLHTLLAANGWTEVTALCVMLFTLFHFPCGTTCLTIWRETKSIRWTALAVLLPTAIGAALCAAVRLIAVLL
ncbi:MAG: ferrous iron transporter B, partial [Oscillospiraceae bacterium]|nr:ferrous iron transporter B [Oscillospiraceae bacterium]